MNVRRHDVRSVGMKGESISLHDYFAAAALTGLLANPNFDRETTFAALATYCSKAAAAMLAERVQNTRG